MVRRRSFFLPLFAAFHLTAILVNGQPRSGVYEIQSGEYSECCGFAGNSFDYLLPYERQLAIDLTIDRTRNSARMRILSGDGQAFRPSWSSTLPRFDFDNGMIFPDRIEFDNLFAPTPGGTRYKYVIRYDNDTLTLNGHLRHPICCDIPTDYHHTNVAASLVLNAATLSIRALDYPWTFEGNIREVEVCWDTLTNRTYQLQYQSPTNTWIDLGSLITAQGPRHCIRHNLIAAPPKRIYRVVTTQ